MFMTKERNVDTQDSTLETKAMADELGQVYHQFQEANDRSAAEERRKGAADPLSEEKTGRLNERIERLETQIARATAAKLRSPVGLETGTVQMDEAKAAFRAFVRRGEMALETKALSSGVDADGGFTIPEAIHAQIIEMMGNLSPVRQQANVMAVATSALEILVDQGVAASAWVAETGARNETDSPTLANVRVPVHELYAEPRASQALLDDSKFDMESWLAGRIAERMAGIENLAFTTGNGTGQPRGFLSYNGGTSWGQIERVTTGVNGGWPASAPADKLIELFGTLKSGYLPGAVWMMNRTVLAEIRRFKGTDNAYLWQPGLNGDTPSTLLGYPVVINEDMPNRANGSVSVAFGNFKRGYAVVDRADLRILRDPFTAKPFVKFYATKRVGGDVMNFEAIKLLHFAA